MNHALRTGILVSGLIVCLVPSRLHAAPTTQPANRMGTEMGPMVLHGVALSDAIGSLRNASGEDIRAHWSVLKKSGVTPALPVTIDLSNLTLGRALDRLIAEVAGSHAHLGYEVDGNVVAISTTSDLATHANTRVYDVRKAIKGAASRKKAVASLIRLVEGIDPLSWKDAGGEVGSVRELNGQLIITQTPQVQERIAAALRDIRPTTN